MLVDQGAVSLRGWRVLSELLIFPFHLIFDYFSWELYFTGFWHSYLNSCSWHLIIWVEELYSTGFWHSYLNKFFIWLFQLRALFSLYLIILVEESEVLLERVKREIDEDDIKNALCKVGNSTPWFWHSSNLFIVIVQLKNEKKIELHLENKI